MILLIIILDPVQKNDCKANVVNGYITAMRMSDPLHERTWKKAAAERNKIKFACLGKSSSAETQNPICLACDGLSQLPRWVHGSNWIKLMAISSKVCRHIVYSLGTLLSLACWHICALAAGFQKLSFYECQIPTLKNDFFENHLESFPDC